jgi:hypothetical protein
MKAASFLFFGRNNNWIQNLPGLLFVTILLLFFPNFIKLHFLPMIPSNFAPWHCKGKIPFCHNRKMPDTMIFKVQRAHWDRMAKGCAWQLCGAHGKGDGPYHASLG